MPECNPIDTLKLAKNIVEMSNTLEYYIQKHETRATKMETMTSEYPRRIRKMKKKTFLLLLSKKRENGQNLQRIVQKE